MPFLTQLKEFLGDHFFGTLVTAAFGAFAGAWATSRRETKRSVVAELNSISAARAVCFSIANSFISLKRQHITAMKSRYDSARAQFILDGAAAVPGTTVEFHADLQNLSPIRLPTETLERQVFEKTSIRGRGLVAAVSLIGAIDSMERAIEYRNDLIKNVQDHPMPAAHLAKRYFGLRDGNGNVDEKFKSNIEALSLYTDDCIFFSCILAKDLFLYGTKLRRRFAWRFRLGIPKLIPEDWSQAIDAGLIPPDSAYEDWLRGFEAPPTFMERVKKKSCSNRRVG